MPAAEIDIDDALVRALLVEQQPDLADLPLSVLANGWDNVLFRLGNQLLVRLPRRSLSAPLVDNELRWLPDLAPRLPLPIPAPVRAGTPSQALGYPWQWTVVPWFAGESALADPPVDQRATAISLGQFLAALHRPAPAEAPRNPYRGVPLADRREQWRANLTALGRAVDAPRLASLFDELSAVPAWDGPDLWVHGDVHPGNLVVRDGELAAVVDFGDLCRGDRASDLVVAWMLFDQPARDAFRSAAGAEREIDDATWARARAWALALGVAIAANSADNRAYAELAARTLAAAQLDA
jgi:aminoglycoside phosphotransferase (APT) family kinase protein